MNKRLKIFFLSLILSIPFWLGVNFFARETESFFYNIALANNPELISANISQNILERKLQDLKADRTKILNMENAGINSRAAISVRTPDKELFSINPNDRVAIASITKLMTSLIVLDTYNLDLLIGITDEAADQEGNSRYKNIVPGEELSVNSLLHILLIESSNDAAYALTEPIGYDNFVDLMNIYAKNIGLDNSYFINPSGLDPEDPASVKNYSSPKDLVKLAKYIIENYPIIFEITVNDYYRVINPDGSLHHIIGQSTNKLLREDDKWETTIIGGKTGFSQLAGGCLLIVLKDKNTYYINVILGASDRFAEMRKIINAINND